MSSRRKRGPARQAGGLWSDVGPRMSRARRLALVCGAVIAAAGIAIMVYPSIQQLLYTMRAHDQIAAFDQRCNDKRNDWADLYAAMQAYNRDIYESGQSGLKDPFSYAVPSFDLTAWGIEDGVFGYIDIPSMGVRLPLYLGATEGNMELGAAQLSQTSIPLGGANTNSVIAGHRGYSGALMFRNIEDMRVGDRLTVTNLWGTLTYECVDVNIIKPNEIDQVLIQPGKDMVTLLSCHPFPYNYQRYVVYCERVG